MQLSRLFIASTFLVSLGCDPGNARLGNGGGGGGGGGGDQGGPDAAPVDTDPRVTVGLQALYRFDEGSGTIVGDSSGQVPALDLTIADPLAVQWLPGGGLDITSPTIISMLQPPYRLGNTCRASNELSLEVWFQPAAVNQEGPARIMTLSIDPGNRNFMIGQDNAQAVGRIRTTATDPNGTPATVSPMGAAIQHAVLTRDPISDEGRLYVDGQLVGTQTVAGTFENWDPEYLLAFGNELTEDRPWRGQLHLAAVYCRALSADEVLQNYEAGY